MALSLDLSHQRDPRADGAHRCSPAPPAPGEDLKHKLQTPEALTAALLGLLGANAIIGPTLGGQLGRRRARAENE
jgi:hypothetical protein